MSTKNEFLRFASPNEQRTVSREDGGFYQAIIVGAVYDFEDTFDVKAPSSFYHALQSCITEHPYLSVVVGDTHTDKAFFERVQNLDLENHISINDGPDAEDSLNVIQDVLVSNVDTPFPCGIPPWKIIVRPLQQGCFIAFSFSHTVGDGITGVAFHRTLLRALATSNEKEAQSADRLIPAPTKPLPGPFDTPQRLPISWSFLLGPLLGHILPSFISNLLRLKASAAATDAGTWTGTNVPHNWNDSHSRIKVREIDAPVLERILRAVRNHDAKLTGTFTLIVARALSKINLDPTITNFASQTAVNMRGSIGVPNSEGGMYASGCYNQYPRLHTPPITLTDDDWESIRSATRKLAHTASTLQDQAIGLLRYATSIRKWTFAKLGKPRDCSFEVSNIGVFGGEEVGNNEAGVKVTKVVFTQPGQVIGAPLTFQLFSLKGGSLVYTVSWRNGALGIKEDEEEGFVQAVCLSIEDDLAGLV